MNDQRGPPLSLGNPDSLIHVPNLPPFTTGKPEIWTASVDSPNKIPPTISAFDRLSAIEMEGGLGVSAGSGTYMAAYKRPPYIGVSGIIASGKTTLVKSLSRELNMDAALEPVKTNPYLALFYGDMEKYSFPLQMWFLNSRFRQHMRILCREDRGVIQDRTAHEDPIFALMLHKSGKMSDLDFQTYASTFDNMSRFFQKPDLYIYLDVSPEIAYARIQSRMREEMKVGEKTRECETTIDIGYLTALKAEYEEWLETSTNGIPILRLDWNHPISIEEVAKLVRMRLKL